MKTIIKMNEVEATNLDYYVTLSKEMRNKALRRGVSNLYYKVFTKRQPKTQLLKSKPA